MDKKEAQELFDKYAANLCTPEERAIVERWYASELAAKPAPHVNGLDDTKGEIWEGVVDRAGLSVETSRRKPKMWIAAAAVLFMLMSAGIYFYALKPKPLVNETRQMAAGKLPGRNEALLTLDDGSKISLDKAAKGTLASQGNTLITKTGDGQLNYHASAKAGHTAGTAAKYNTISTARGGQYRVVLPDGTTVWLNAASSIRFPATFEAAERNVELSGEAYFEVAPNKTKPFNVIAGKTNVRVLGTHFNVMAYPDEASVNTTLLEGSVKVSTGKAMNILKPGQQAKALKGAITVLPADTEEAIAWKKGYFYFDDADIRTVMRQISRWYDVDVAYHGNTSEMVFSGKMYRNVDILKMLEVLTYFNVNYKVVDSKDPRSKKTIVIN